MQHKFERWFFNIMFMSAFIIVSVFVGDILDSAVRIQTQRVTTFQQLAEINPPIELYTSLSMNNDEIQARLQRKMGANIDYKGFEENGRSGNKTHVAILPTYWLGIIYDMSRVKGRDIDVIQESLGIIRKFIVIVNFR